MKTFGSNFMKYWLQDEFILVREKNTLYLCSHQLLRLFQLQCDMKAMWRSLCKQMKDRLHLQMVEDVLQCRMLLSSK